MEKDTNHFINYGHSMVTLASCSQALGRFKKYQCLSLTIHQLNGSLWNGSWPSLFFLSPRWF